VRPKRYLWGAIIAAALSVPTTLIGVFAYVLLRPGEQGQSIFRALEIAMAFGVPHAIRWAPLAAGCGALITFVVFRTPALASATVAGLLSATCAGTVWFLSTRWSAGIVAQVLGPIMAVAWGATAIVATSIAARRLNRQQDIGVTQ